MGNKIAAKTLERWPEACSNRARVDNLLQQAAPFNHRQENAPVDDELTAAHVFRLLGLANTRSRCISNPGGAQACDGWLRATQLGLTFCRSVKMLAIVNELTAILNFETKTGR
jgi:hypothetical protein